MPPVTGINRAYLAFLDALDAEQETIGPCWSANRPRCPSTDDKIPGVAVQIAVQTLLDHGLLAVYAFPSRNKATANQPPVGAGCDFQFRSGRWCVAGQHWKDTDQRNGGSGAGWGLRSAGLNRSHWAWLVKPRHSAWQSAVIRDRTQKAAVNSL
jgi:hypothetical protein